MSHDASAKSGTEKNSDFARYLHLLGQPLGWKRPGFTVRKLGWATAGLCIIAVITVVIVMVRS
jgi:hypothetical protein